MSSPRQRGFTLIELLAVIAIISVLVVAASPTFIRLVRDRRVNRAAMNLVDFMRSARTMAVGRGQPILVSWNANGVLPPTNPGGTGYVEIDEPVITLASAAQNCSTTLWHTPAAQMVQNFDLQNGKYTYTTVVFYDDAGATPNYSEICFSATGRMYLRDGAGGVATTAFHPVIGVPAFAVFNIDNNPGLFLATARWVFVPPSGVARMQL